MTELEAAMVLQRIRARLAGRLGMTVAEMRGESRSKRPMPPTAHQLQGGLACEGC